MLSKPHRCYLLIALTSILAVPAHAQMTDDQLRELTSGLHNTATSWSEIDTSVAQLKGSIDSECKSMSPPGVTDIQNRFKKLVQFEAQSKLTSHTAPTMTQALTITHDLNVISARLRDHKSIESLSIEGLEQCRKDLIKQVNAASSAVLLTRVDADRLLARLEKISDLTGGSVASKKGPSSPQTKRVQDAELALELAKAHLAHALKLTQSAIADLNKREADLEMSIDHAKGDDLIDQKEATAFRHKLDLITMTQSNYVNSNVDGPLSSVQLTALANELDQLQSAVYHSHKPKTPTAPGLTPFTHKERTVADPKITPTTKPAVAPALP